MSKSPPVYGQWDEDDKDKIILLKLSEHGKKVYKQDEQGRYFMRWNWNPDAGKKSNPTSSTPVAEQVDNNNKADEQIVANKKHKVDDGESNGKGNELKTSVEVIKKQPEKPYEDPFAAGWVNHDDIEVDEDADSEYEKKVDDQDERMADQDEKVDDQDPRFSPPPAPPMLPHHAEFLANYTNALAECQGFDLDFPNPYNITMPGAIVQFQLPFMRKEELQKAAEFCVIAIKVYNKRENANYRYQRLLKVNGQMAAGLLYYLTFEAAVEGQGETLTFQAKVWDDRFGKDGPKKKVLLCRVKPPPPTSS